MNEQNNELLKDINEETKVAVPAEQIAVPQEKKTNYKKLLMWGLPILVVAFGVVAFLLLSADESTGEQNAQVTENAQQKQPAQEEVVDTHRVVYWTDNGDVETTGRTYPSYKLWYQDSTREPVEVEKVFGGSEDFLHIEQTEVTANGKFVYLQYGNKVEQVELDTGKIAVVATAGEDESITGISLNNDETSIVVASGANDFEDQTTYLDEYTLPSLEATRVFEGDTPWGLVPLAENGDGIWLVQHPRGTEGFFYGTFNSNSSTLSDTSSGFLVKYSANGVALSSDSTSEANVCDGFSGSSPTAHTLVNPFTGTETGIISRPGSHIRVKEFSRDGKNVLLLVKQIPALTEYDESVCNTYWDEDNGWELVSTDVTDSSPKTVSTAGEAYDIWNPEQPNPFVSQIGNTCTATLLDGQSVTSDCDKDVTIRILRTVQTN